MYQQACIANEATYRRARASPRNQREDATEPWQRPRIEFSKRTRESSTCYEHRCESLLVQSNHTRNTLSRTQTMNSRSVCVNVHTRMNIIMLFYATTVATAQPTYERLRIPGESEVRARRPRPTGNARTNSCSRN